MGLLLESTHRTVSHRVSLLLLAAFSLLLYTYLLLISPPPVQLVKYWHAAELILTKQMPPERILDFSPSYLYLNVFLQKIKLSITVLSWLHIAFVTTSCAMLYELLLKNFRRVVSFAATLAFLLSRSLIVFTGTFEPESLLILLLISTVYFLQRSSLKAALTAGICVGVAIWTRPSFAPFLFFVPIWFFIQPVHLHWKQKALHFVLPAIVCIGCLWLRNTSTLGYFTPYVMNPGTVFYEGNNPNSRGLSSIYPPVLNQIAMQYMNLPDYHHELYRRFARSISGNNLTILQVNSYWENHALNFLLDHPRQTAGLLATKLFHTFHSYEWHDLSSSFLFQRNLEQKHFYGLPFGFFSSLGICGMIAGIREWRKYLIYYALLAVQIFSMLTIYTSGRQRISILFVLVFFACVTVEFVIGHWKGRVVAMFALAFLLLFQRKTDLMKEEDHLWQHSLISEKLGNQAYSLRRQGRMKEAADYAANAAAFAPWLLDFKRPSNLPFESGYIQSAIAFVKQTDSASTFDMGVLLLESKQATKARQIFQQLLDSRYDLKRDHHQSSNLEYYLARCDLLDGHTSSAIARLKAGIDKNQGDPWVLSYLVALTKDSKYRMQLFRYFDDIDAQFFLGQAYLQTGQPAKAAQCFRSVIEWIPDFRRA